jgi:release factor glutamine methyltransferase
LEAIQRSTEFLERKGVETPRLQAELLLAHVLSLPRLRLYLDFERLLSDEDTARLRDLVKRRGNREPLQHLVGSTSFCGLEIKVSPAVLIPRPETEVLAELAWQWLQSVAAERPAPRVLDFGTGSGCLAITLAVKCPGARITALEVSPEALAVARANACHHGVTERIDFIEGDGLWALGSAAEFDLIVANPPYIPSAEIATLQREVREHDPRRALDGGPDGLACIRQIADAGAGCLRSGGRLLMEFGDGQTATVLRLFNGAAWRDQTVHNDLAARPRILVATRAAK